MWVLFAGDVAPLADGVAANRFELTLAPALPPRTLADLGTSSSWRALGGRSRELLGRPASGCPVVLRQRLSKDGLASFSGSSIENQTNTESTSARRRGQRFFRDLFEAGERGGKEIRDGGRRVIARRQSQAAGLHPPRVHSVFDGHRREPEGSARGSGAHVHLGAEPPVRTLSLPLAFFRPRDDGLGSGWASAGRPAHTRRAG